MTSQEECQALNSQTLGLYLDHYHLTHQGSRAARSARLWAHISPPTLDHDGEASDSTVRRPTLTVRRPTLTVRRPTLTVNPFTLLTPLVVPADVPARCLTPPPLHPSAPRQLVLTQGTVARAVSTLRTPAHTRGTVVLAVAAPPLTTLNDIPAVATPLSLTAPPLVLARGTVVITVISLPAWAVPGTVVLAVISPTARAVPGTVVLAVIVTLSPMLLYMAYPSHRPMRKE